MKRYLLLFALAALLWNCQKEAAVRVPAIEVVDADSLQFSALENTAQVQLISDRDWTMTVPEGSAGWLTVDPTQGSGNQQINLALERNFGAPRTTTLTLQAPTDYVGVVGASGTIKVKQSSVTASFQSVARMTFGKTLLSNPVNASAYTDWGNEGSGSYWAVCTAGSNDVVVITPATPSADYMSGGNCLSFVAPANFTISKINAGAGGEMTLFFAAYKSDNESITPKTISAAYRAEPNGTWTDLEIHVLRDQQGWCQAYSDFSFPQGGYISIRLSASEACLLDAPTLYFRTETPAFVLYDPVVTTSAVTNVGIFSATANGNIVYPDAAQPLLEKGFAWKRKVDAEFTYQASKAPLLAGGGYTSPLNGLKSATEYECKAYAKAPAIPPALPRLFEGAVFTFTTLPYTPPPTSSKYVDYFSSITTEGIAYMGSGAANTWGAENNAGVVEAGWVTYNSGRQYITVAPSATVYASGVKAYSVVNPFNVSGATDKNMYFCTSYNLNGASASDAKLTVQISTDFAGSALAATWTPVQTISLPAENTWSIQTINLSAYATQSRVYVAFLYEGKGVRYNISCVSFGQYPPILFYQPAWVSGMGLKFGSNTNADAVISVPYSFGGGLSTTGLVTCDNPALTLTPADGALNGTYYASSNFMAAGTLADFTPVTFTVNATSPVSSILPVTDGNMPLTFDVVTLTGNVPYEGLRTGNPSLVSIMYEKQANENDSLKYVTSGGAGTTILTPVVFSSNGVELFRVQLYDQSPLGTLNASTVKTWTNNIGLNVLPNAGSGAWGTSTTVAPPRTNGIIYTIPVRKLPLWGDVKALLTFCGGTAQHPAGIWTVEYSTDNGLTWTKCGEKNMGSNAMNAANSDVVLDARFTIPELNKIPPGNNIKFWVYRTSTLGANGAAAITLRYGRPITVTYSHP